MARYELTDEQRKLINPGFAVHETSRALQAALTKKADVAEHPRVFDHVGLLIDEPPGTGLLFI
jgi:hypothetical protein